MKIVGIILIVLGILGFIFRAVTYTTEETVLDLGPIEAKAEKENTIPIPEIASGVAVVAGIVLVIIGIKR